MSVSETPSTRRADGSRPRKALTIGAVCKILQNEFDDVSISKIRYLEDQKLLNPRRTSGGYRLYGQSDVERLRTILRLQRDEFLLATMGPLLARCYLAVRGSENEVFSDQDAAYDIRNHFYRF